MKKNISIVLFSIWCAVSGAMWAIGMDIENYILKLIGAINLIIIILMILCKSEKDMNNDNII